jgi:hypothetical protein
MLRCFVDIDNGHTYGRGNERLATKRATAASLASGTARSERQKKDIQKYKASFADLYFGVLLATWFPHLVRKAGELARFWCFDLL